MEIRVEQRDGARQLSVAGELTLPHAGQLRQALIDAAASGEDTLLDVAAVTAIDLSGMQLLCSAHRTYRKQGGSIRISEMAPQARAAARSAGFECRTLTCPYRDAELSFCFWKEV